MLFYGPPGTGKTSTILALARDLFGPTLYRSRLLELNASDERGIDVIREKVKNFAKTTVRETVPGYPCPPFKLILLDEADSLTADAQTALRRIMEVYTRGTRFCLLCNYVSRIIEPLTSRCAKFRFRPVETTAGMAKLQAIATAEDVQLSDQGALATALEVAGGDLRRAITLLQSVHGLGGPVTAERIREFAGIPPVALAGEAMRQCRQPAVNPLAEWVQHAVIREAHSVQKLLGQLLQEVLGDPEIPAGRKALITLRFSQVDYALVDGADEALQLMSLLAHTQAILTAKDKTSLPLLQPQ